MAKTTERLSPHLVKAILLGLRDELRSGEHAWRMEALGCGPTLEVAVFTDELSVHVRLQEGSGWVKSSRMEFFDDLTGFPLNADHVRRARDEEMKYLVGSLNVWSLASPPVALADMGGVKPIPVRWVNINSGSFTSLEYRSRLDVAETKFQVDNCMAGHQCFQAHRHGKQFACYARWP